MARKTRKKVKKPESVVPVLAGLGLFYIALKTITGKKAPESTGQRPADRLRLCINRIKTKLADAQVMFTDSVYKIYTLADVKKFLDSDQTDKKQYVPEDWDCDNFAMLLYVMAEMAMPGCCLGVAFVSTPQGYHAVNIFIDENGTAHLIEPQTDEFLGLPSNNIIYWILI